MSYQVSVLYNGKKIVPGPALALTREVQRSPDGLARLRVWKITARGKLVAFMGSPDHAGTFWTASGYPPDTPANLATPDLRLKNLEAKAGGLSALFAEDGHWFEVQPGDGSAPLKFQPRVQSVEFAEGPWFNTVDFAVQMEADAVYFGTKVDPTDAFSATNNPAEESWAVEPADDFRPTWRLTHTASATAHNRFKSDASGAIDQYGWELAKTSVDAVLGYDSSLVSDTLGLTGFSAFNRNLSRQVDKAAGKYQVTETWVLAEQNYNEDQTVETAWSADTGLYAVRVSGTVTGLQAGSDPAERYANAVAHAATITTAASRLAVAQAESGVTLNPAPLATSITRSKPQGVVGYSFEFNTRPAVPAGLLSQSVQVSVDHAVPVVAQIGVIARPQGPVLQDVGSYTQQAATVQADLKVAVAYGQPDPAAPAFDALAAFAQYVGSFPTVYVAADREAWNPKTGQYSRTTTFIYQS